MERTKNEVSAQSGDPGDGGWFLTPAMVRCQERQEAHSHPQLSSAPSPAAMRSSVAVMSLPEGSPVLVCKPFSNATHCFRWGKIPGSHVQMHMLLSQWIWMDLCSRGINVFIKIRVCWAVTNLSFQTQWLRFNFMPDYSQLRLQTSPHPTLHTYCLEMNVTPQLLKQLWIRNDGFGQIRSIRKISRLRGS